MSPQSTLRSEALDKLATQPARTRRTSTRKKESPKSEPKKLRCRACKSVISDESQLFQGSSGAPLYMNRYGFLHEIFTVRSAQNLAIVGDPTTTDTWFTGYAWQIALCATCGEHSGWRYSAVAESATPRSFFGLRKAAIVVS